MVVAERISETLKKEINEFISQHEKMSGAYFFSPPSNAAGRRSYEEKNSKEINFTFDGKKYSFELTVSCSCNNVYVSKNYTVDGVKKDIRALKKLV